jgi:hypothetical protein
MIGTTVPENTRLDLMNMLVRYRLLKKNALGKTIVLGVPYDKDSLGSLEA